MPEPITTGASPASRAVTNASQWRAEVSARLADLQTGLDELDAGLTEDRKRRVGSLRAWLLAVIVFRCSLVLVVIGIQKGLAASTDAATASRLDAQAASIIYPCRKKYPETTAGGNAKVLCEIDSIQTSTAGYDRMLYDQHKSLSDQAQSERYQRSANQLQLLGPAAVALGSALTGAVLGWMLTAWLGRYSRRSSRRQAGEPESLQ
jgi:hypothetical protein